MSNLNPQIIFEDDSLLLIDKPAGITVNKSETTKEETIQDWAEKKLAKEIKEETDPVFKSRAGIVHRLDKETSGYLLIAKNNQSFLNLQSQFKERAVTKKYLTLVHGILEPSSGTINAPIDRLPWNREHFGVFPGGREAKTDYQTLNIYQNGEKYSLLEITPHTGRTHQIRVHLKYLGHPVVGDDLYAGRKTGRDDRKFCSRHFLHAAYIKFTHPQTSLPLEFTSHLPPDLAQVLSSLTKIS